jgi:hypothetical protein
VERHQFAEGERMIIPCEGGPNSGRLVYFPPPLEIEVGTTGVYVLDERPGSGGVSGNDWVYVFIEQRM